MRYAADLHLHSHYSAAVSKHMTLETIGRSARVKGIDVIGTGDCLQPEWLTALEASLLPAEDGWFLLRPDLEIRITASLPPILQQPLRFVLSTEVSCAPPGSERLRGIHHLLYFPSFEGVHRFRREISRHGDLAEGRPTLALTSRELLEIVAKHDGEMAPAHVMNPYFSSLGTLENIDTLPELFGDLTPRLLAVETGLTSTPEMCRRMSTLDGHALFSNSDAHSPENIGRECTILETEPGFAPMIAALRSGARPQVLGTLKFPLPCTRYYLNRCAACAASFEGDRCPQCQGRLVMGSRDRLERIADRSRPEFAADAPPFRMLLPLRDLLGHLCRTSRTSKTVDRFYEPLISQVGHERFVLTKADRDRLLRACPPPVAQAIIAQRRTSHVFTPTTETVSGQAESQPSFF